MFNVFLLDMLRISLQIEWQTQMSLFKLLLNLLEWIRNYLLVNVHTLGAWDMHHPEGEN